MKILLQYAATAIIFFGIDMVWLGWLARGFYRSQVGPLMLRQVNWLAAGIFYAIYLAGILYFAVLPHATNTQWQPVLAQGMLLGGLCYATYDLTNMATLKGWTWKLVIVDIAWGIVLTGLTTLLSWWVSSTWL